MLKKISASKIFAKKNSIFIKLLLPTVVVLLFQVVLVSVVLLVNGTVESLEENAKATLLRNAENRRITLENQMVHTWSNLDPLEAAVSDAITQYLGETGLTAGQALGVDEHETAILSKISGELVNSLLMTSTTGVFVFFADESTPLDDDVRLGGIYLRDLDPVSVSPDYSDILFEKGPAAIARQNKIQMSSLWSETYVCRPFHTETWNAVFSPFRAALEHPELNTKDLAFWSAPHYLNSESKLDSNQCITYTRPLFYDGRLIGVIGTELQTDYLIRFFPSEDIDGMGGYMLLRYDAGTERNASLSCAVYDVTGSYIKRLATTGNTLTLNKSGSDNMYTARSDTFEPAHAAVQPIKLYNSNTPFSGEQWALAAVLPDDILFGSAIKIRTGILQSSLIALALGFVVMFFSIRLVTRPLLSIAGQIEKGSPDDPVVIKNSRTYEVMLLCDTINDMKDKRKTVETALREERERYMIALESATDTFMEYDISGDRFMIYFFTEDNQKFVLSTNVIENFSKMVDENGVCHPSDIWAFIAVLHGHTSDPCEVRMRVDLFPQISGEASDGGYYWFFFKAAQIAGEDGALKKIIGSARHITQEKLDEYARLEANHRDSTTGLYNREYGELVITRLADASAEAQKSYCIAVIAIDNFDAFETHYGRVYSAVILREVSRVLSARLPAGDSLVRWSNGELVMFCESCDAESLERDLEGICAGVYTGENPDLRLSLSAGVARSESAADMAGLLSLAFAAAERAGLEGGGCAMFCDELSMDAPYLDITPQRAPVSLSVDVSRESIIGFVLSLFEHTVDIDSVINMLMRVLGEVFSLERIIICEYDQDFGSNQAVYQWNVGAGAPHPGGMERTAHADFTDLTARFDENGTLLYNSDSARGFGKGVRRLLCVQDGDFSALCCAMYENGLHTGRAIFLSNDNGRLWGEYEIHSLYEITKIIATHFSLAKSNSASKAKSEFLSRMSHEIRTPMNAIIGMTKIAKESEKNAERLDDCLDKIDLSAKHLLSLINDILDMSRIESGKMQIETRPYSLISLIESLDTLMRPQLEEKGLSFVITQRVTHPNVLGDEQKLRQVLINLLGNAGKFTDAGVVTLSVEQQLSDDGGFCYCRFSVSDTGVGVVKEDQFKIFNAFEQSYSGNSAAGNPQGTGLGLAISSSFITAMGGRIELVSESGSGSEFFFSLKLVCDSGEARREIPARRTRQEYREKFGGKRVLIVDDNEINLEIAAFIVEDVGFSIRTARDGREAVDAFFSSGQGFFDVIFMDISMPVMDGLTATREIRKNTARSDSRTVPIIAMTANAFSEDTKKSIESGMNAHIAKPIDAELLYATLDRLLLQDER